MALPIGARTNIDEEVTRLKRGIARKLVYAGLADVLMMWGGIFLLNDALITFARQFALLTLVFGVAGLFGTWAICHIRARSPTHAENAHRLLWCFVAFFVCILVWWLLGIPVPLNGVSATQQNTGVLFQLTFNMLGIVLVGIWVGWELTLLGLGVSAIVVLDYLFAPPSGFIGTSMAITALALLAAGFWMRLSAREIRVDPFAVTR